MISKNELALLIASLPFYENLNDMQKKGLLSSTNIFHYDRGNILHSVDNDCVGVLIIKSGTIRTYISSDEGREITLYRLNHGDVCILSASCILNSLTFDVSVIAESDCNILQIDSKFFANLVKQNIYVELFSYKLATTRFSDIMLAMGQILFTSFDKRLAHFLIEESKNTKSDTINMTHEQISKYLGTAREVVSRMLKYFANEEFISLTRGKITLLNKDKLNNI